METTTTEQAPTMMAKPQKEHHWLDKLVGEWTFEGGSTVPDKPEEKFTGTESVRSLGGLWILAEGQGEMPGGGPSRSIMTLGYDPQKQRYVGTWIGSMMANLWVYDGELDEAANALSLYAEGPSFSGDGKMAKYKDVVEFKSDDHRLLRSHMLGDDGSWQEFMTMHFHRSK